MAATMMNHMGRLIQSPPILVVVAGLEGRSDQMQREGWQFSMEVVDHGRYSRFAIYHPGLRLEALSEPYDYDRTRMMWATGERYGAPGDWRSGYPPIIFRQVSSKIQVLRIREAEGLYGPGAWRPIDMEPRMRAVEEQDVALRELAMFAPMPQPKHSIIINPDDEDQLLNRIWELQQPKQEEYLQRMKEEEKRMGAKPQTQVTAQILQFKAA